MYFCHNKKIDMSQPTKTINRLHFSDLDPLRFEDLCLNLVYKINTWKEINHFQTRDEVELATGFFE